MWSGLEPPRDDVDLVWEGVIFKTDLGQEVLFLNTAPHSAYVCEPQ